MTTILAVSHLSNEELLAKVTSLAARERGATTALVASLAELDERRLYLGQGYSPLLTYCTQVLYLSEHAAYGRIEAARAARRFGVISPVARRRRAHVDNRLSARATPDG